ncbi:restriction endonuclease subunit S [Gordonia sputi]|uniref:restriction endonuclease subunit S n=1 Tax=Gordonia sputi TaxID=36823 RepID=UPI002043245C|nr:restriction endonuclease subunit S [Gordonia sputi]MCM3897498.1 restriction endonuclease subunit S [Gordonia sputi]
MTWREAQLGDVALIERLGVAPSEIQDGTTYVGLENIKSGGGFVDVEQVVSGQLASTKFTFSDDHILYGKLRPYLAKIEAPDFPGVCSTDILPIRPGPELDRRYLLHFLRQPSQVALADSRSSGANLPRLSPTELAKFSVPLPPLPEQRRIAAILDHADTLRAKRLHAVSVLDDLGGAAFQHFAAGAPQAPLGDLLTFVTSGGRGWAKYYADRGDRFIRSLDVQMNSISDDDLVYVSAPDNAEAGRTRTREGDVLLTITGSRIGRAAALPSSLSGAYISQHVSILRTDTERLLPRYLSAFLCSEVWGQRQIRSSQYGQTKPGLNFKQIRDFAIPLPAVRQQQKFCDFAAASECRGEMGREALAATKMLFDALQSRAFSGEL